MRQISLAILLLFWMLQGCQNIHREAPGQNNSTIPSQSIEIQAWFSQTSGNYHTGEGIDRYLIGDIDQAKQEVLVAIYAMTNDRIRDALIRAHERGLHVEVLTDSANYFSDDFNTLRAHGIPVYSDTDDNALMHDKFTVIDAHIVWSGSCNYTYYAFYRNNENLVKIESLRVAEVYKEEFEELKNEHYIEQACICSTADTGLEVWFSPEDDFEQRLLDLITHARKRIDFLAFAFTSAPLADALIAKEKEGVAVRGVMDEKENSYQKSSKYALLKENGIALYLDANKFTLHDKIMIIDDTVVTGSYNFTHKANVTNNENALVVRKREFTALYEKEFSQIFTLAQQKAADE
jgi:phosphatidylserine/phosphatidylglycerophosphate/cardiolipin synthase-like enzyme